MIIPQSALILLLVVVFFFIWILKFKWVFVAILKNTLDLNSAIKFGIDLMIYIYEGHFVFFFHWNSIIFPAKLIPRPSDHKRHMGLC